MLWKYLLFSIILLRQETQGRPSTKLQKIIISNPEAVCNDNSRAVFYIGAHSRKKWILFFESGGLCSSREDCNERYLNRDSTVLMTSKVLPDEVTGKDLLSPLERENPMFHSYTHVLVPYCSSDLWLGSRSGPDRKPFYFLDDPSVDNFSFRGDTIFQSVFSELRKEFNLSDAEEIILAGSSAGAIGVLHHAMWVLDNVILSHGLNAKLLSILDSSWFIDFQDSIKSRVKPGFAKMANISSKACADISYGYSCCLSSSCMLQRGYFPTNVPVMFVFSLYDIYMFAEVLKRLEDQGKTAEYHSADFLSVVSMYGGAMNQSIMLSQRQAQNMSYFVPACFQHTYLSTSSLWNKDGILRPLVEVTRGTGKFTHRIQSGIWTSTRIKKSTTDMSLQEFLSAWVQSGFTRAALIDSCIGAHCNPTCPDKLVFIDSGIIWHKAVKGIVIALSLVITIVCLGLKSSFTFYYNYLAWKQIQYFDDSETFQARKELPLTRTDEAISIACLSLTYLVDIKKKKLKGETDGDSKEDRNSRMSVVIRGSIAEEDTGSDDQDFDEDGEMNLLGSKAANENSNLENAERTLEERSSQRQHSESFGSYDVNSPRGSSTESHQALMSDSKDGGSLSCISPTLKHDQSLVKDTSRLKKQILKGVSAYFNTGELVAIMGPSGCGKTTFLDLLTGRRRDGDCKGQVYINGVELGKIQDWYACKIGYVLQLALPYYEELTVRENLFFAAHMRLSKETKVSEKFERVEQIIAETGLTSVAEIKVGGSKGLGLSGGQKRRLCVALQMINMPSVLFLDEPTSGLDATSSLELLNHLNLVAESGRLVILTIHQPRLEIFHLFHKILFLCDGQVAYYGEPSMAPEIFLKAYAEATTEEFRLSDEAPKIDAKNPADTIMDLLNCSQARRAILDYYQTSGEPQAVQEAINTAQKNATQTTTNTSRMAKIDGDAGSFNRIFVLESRAAERQTLGQILYFPVIFCMFGIIIGTVYWKAEERDGILLMSAYCVYCCASPLFLSSVLMTHLNKALEIFHLEREDGCGRSYENVIETFIRTVAVCVLPVIICSSMSYFMVMTTYDLWKFSFVTLISLVLNQTWIAVYMMVICAQPRIAHRICPMVSAIGGFAGGFLVPRPQMPIVYNLLFYINPQFYGYSAITKVLLLNVRLKCEYESTLSCISTDGNAVLSRFGFENVNPYEHVVIMLAMTISSLLFSWLFLEAKYFNLRAFRKRPVLGEAEGPTDVKVAIEPIDEVPANRTEEELFEEVPELPVDFVSPFTRNRRSAKSQLGLISIDHGFHTVKLPAQRKRCVAVDSTFRTGFKEAGGEVEDAAQFRPRCRSSALQRDLWMSTRRRMEERKITLDRRMTQVQHLARRFSIHHSHSVRRRAKESASIPRRSTMATAAVADVNREQFPKRRNISRPHDGVLDRFNEETEMSPHKGEETNTVNSERLTDEKRVSSREELNLTTLEGKCLRSEEKDGCTLVDSIELVDKEDSKAPSKLKSKNIPEESTALSSDLEHGSHLKMESPSSQRNDQMERTNKESIKTILKQGNDRRSLANSSSPQSFSSQAEKQAEKNEKSKKKVSIVLSDFTDVLDI